MIVVILTFMVCNVPAKIVQAVWQYQQQPCKSAAFFLMELSSVLEVFSSAVNFVVYCAFLRRFRRHLLAAVRCLGVVAAGSRDKGGVAEGSGDETTRSVGGSTMQPLAHTTGTVADADVGATVEIVDDTSAQFSQL